jgi:hypothetical protein
MKFSHTKEAGSISNFKEMPASSNLSYLNTHEGPYTIGSTVGGICSTDPVGTIMPNC